MMTTLQRNFYFVKSRQEVLYHLEGESKLQSKFTDRNSENGKVQKLKLGLNQEKGLKVNEGWNVQVEHCKLELERTINHLIGLRIQTSRNQWY